MKTSARKKNSILYAAAMISVLLLASCALERKDSVQPVITVSTDEAADTESMAGMGNMEKAGVTEGVASADDAADTMSADSTADTVSAGQADNEAGQAADGNYIVVTKSEHRLVLYDAAGNEIKEYRAGFAQNPVGAKEKQGDKKTPEGEYYICVKNAASKFHKALGLSYPDSDDAERGFEAGLITQEQKDSIDAAIAAGGKPDWYTALGGEIMIHGQKGQLGSGSNWTTGCIALNNEDIDDLWNYTEVGTKVTILP